MHGRLQFGLFLGVKLVSEGEFLQFLGDVVFAENQKWGNLSVVDLHLEVQQRVRVDVEGRVLRRRKMRLKPARVMRHLVVEGAIAQVVL